jgi:hypothetical protein
MTLRALIHALTTLIAAGCGAGTAVGPAGDGGPPVAGGGVGSCAALLQWQGRMYSGLGVARSPEVGERLGDAVMPPCNDTPGANAKGERVVIRRILGVDPRTAFAVGTAFAVDYDSMMVYVLDPNGWRDPPPKLPPAIERLMRVPACAREGTFALRAVWTGIVHPPGHEVEFDGDIGPGPYTLELYVLEGPAEFERAQLDARATQQTRNRLRPRDVKQVLWEGGTLDLTVRCTAGGGMMVEAIAPRD